MAHWENVDSISLEASADLSAHQFKFVSLDANGRVALAGAGANAIGVLQNKPTALGAAAEVAVRGRIKVLAGAAVVIGNKLASNASGLAVAAVATNHVLGIALTAAAAANEVVEMQVPTNFILA